MNLHHLGTPQRISAVAILVVILGAFLPWVSIFGISANGVEGDGAITLLASIIGLVVLLITTGVFTQPKRAGKVAEISLVVLAAIVALIALIDMNGAAAIGLYLTLFGGVAWLVGSIWALTVTRAAGAADSPSA